MSENMRFCNGQYWDCAIQFYAKTFFANSRGQDPCPLPSGRVPAQLCMYLSV